MESREEKYNDDEVEELTFTSLRIPTIKMDNNFYNEKEILKDSNRDFDYTIKQRGRHYYRSGMIQNIFKTENEYFAKVHGSNNEVYDVNIIIDKYGLEYFCTCPCEFNCKHEYAVLMAISNQDYSNVALKKEVEEKEIDLKSLLEKIPAEELKEYFLSHKNLDSVFIEMTNFNNWFRKYLPTQEYEYYYNNLYNSLVLENHISTCINEYLDIIKQYVVGNVFSEVVKIEKAIINAYHDSSKLSCDNSMIDIIMKLGMNLRIAYRKSDEEVKEDIYNWFSELEKENFYNNYYLEDMFLTIIKK